MFFNIENHAIMEFFTLADLLQFGYVKDTELFLLSKKNMFTLNQIRMLFSGFSVAKKSIIQFRFAA